MAEMTKERLAEIAAREQAATKGPWGPHEMPPLSESHEWMEIGPYPAEPVAEVDCCNGDNWRNDADFIGHSRQDIPDLLAEVERLRTENDDLNERVEDLTNERDGAFYTLNLLEGQNAANVRRCAEIADATYSEYYNRKKFEQADGAERVGTLIRREFPDCFTEGK